MHLPDGFLDAKTALLTGAAAVSGVGLALRHLRTALPPRQVPMLGLASAFLFTAQLLNFPVAGGTSGHLMGGVLAAILLGPAAAVLVMTCVLVVQCLMFADGGLSALGANIFNMAVVSAGGGYLVYVLARKMVRCGGDRATVFAAAFAGWFGTVLSSIFCAAELALANTVPWSLAFPAMANVHMLIGLGEGLVTGLVVLAVLRSRRSLDSTLEFNLPQPSQNRFWGYSLLVLVGLVVFVAPVACPWPDGLERVASTLGFESRAAAVPAPMAEYRIPGIESATLATLIAGLVGLLVAFVAAYLLARAAVPGISTRGKNAPTAH